MKKLVEDTPCIDIGDIKSILIKDKEKHRLEIKISDEYTQVIDIFSTVGNTGGLVYWFVCPGCRKRVKKIYLSTERSVFLCRNCLGLDYSTQNIREFRKKKYLKKIKKKENLKKIIKSREKLLKELLELKRVLNI